MNIRASITDGIFYPADKAELTDTVKELLKNSSCQDDNAFGIITPHAAYRYTGKSAADSFRSCTKRKITEAVILAPITRDPHDNIFLSDYDFFETPLGKMKTDKDNIEKLAGYGEKFKFDDLVFCEEHSIEVQLPFIQYLFPDALLLPIHLGKQNLSTVKLLGRALYNIFGENSENTVFIASGNTSPYIGKTDALKYEKNFVNMLSENSFDKISEKLTENNMLSPCSGCAAVIAYLCGKNMKTKILSEYNSSPAAPDDSQEKTVCYTSAAFFNE